MKRTFAFSALAFCGILVLSFAGCSEIVDSTVTSAPSANPSAPPPATNPGPPPNATNNQRNVQPKGQAQPQRDSSFVNANSNSNVRNPNVRKPNVKNPNVKQPNVKPPSGTHGTAWLTNYDDALAQAAETGKPILVDFTGSDWCGWCIKLKKEVFSKPKFKEWASENVVLLELDFPKRKKQPAAVKKENNRLAKKYGVRGFPTILFLNADGEKIGKSGYRPGGPDAWIANANKTLRNSS